MFFLMNNNAKPGTDGAEASSVPRKLLRQAAAIADCAEPTALRALAGLPTRGGVRERLFAALKGLGVDPSGTLQLGARQGGAPTTHEKGTTT
jgi:hypothetical protein